MNLLLLLCHHHHHHIQTMTTMTRRRRRRGWCIPPNTLICYYTGHVHTYASAAAATSSISEEEEDDDNELAQQQQQHQEAEAEAEAEGDDRSMRTKTPKKKKKERDRSYLMWIHRDNIFVDPLRCEQIKARYINDPLNDECRNCHYVPTRIPYRQTTTTTTDRVKNCLSRTVRPIGMINTIRMLIFRVHDLNHRK